MEEGPKKTDYTLTTTKMKTDNKKTRTTANERILRKCSCGWEKVTAYRGLQIHQEKARCGQRVQQQPCTASAGDTRGTRSQVENHSANGPNVAESRDRTEEESPTMEADPHKSTNTQSLPAHTERSKEQRPRNQKEWNLKTEAWHNLDTGLIKIPKERLQRGVETKLYLFGNIIYQTCKGLVYDEVIPKQWIAPREKGRTKKEITQLVQRRRYLRKNWRKATLPERGLKVL